MNIHIEQCLSYSFLVQTFNVVFCRVLLKLHIHHSQNLKHEVIYSFFNGLDITRVIGLDQFDELDNSNGTN